MRKAAPPPDTFIENYEDLSDIESAIGGPSREEARAAAVTRLHAHLERQRPFYLATRAAAFLAEGRLCDARQASLHALGIVSPQRPHPVHRLLEVLAQTVDSEGADETLRQDLQAIAPRHGVHELLHVVAAKVDRATGHTDQADHYRELAQNHPEWTRLMETIESWS